MSEAKDIQQEELKWYQLTKYNILYVILFGIIGTAVIFLAPYKNAGMAFIILPWIPLVISFWGIVLFFIFRFFTKKYAFIISALTCLVSLAFAISYYLS